MTDTLAADDPGVGVLVVPGSGTALTLHRVAEPSPFLGGSVFVSPNFSDGIQIFKMKKKNIIPQVNTARESFGSFPKWVGKSIQILSRHIR